MSYKISKWVPLEVAKLDEDFDMDERKELVSVHHSLIPLIEEIPELHNANRLIPLIELIDNLPASKITLLEKILPTIRRVSDKDIRVITAMLKLSKTNDT